MHPELERLTEVALADNRLSGKEMEVLLKKAEKLGIDKDEFEIELDAKKTHQKKDKNSKRINYIKENLVIIGSIGGGFILVITLILVIKLSSKSHKVKVFARKNNLEYANMKDAVIHYDFENAYKLLNYYDEINYNKLGRLSSLKRYIVKTEINYLMSEGYVARALEIASENNYPQHEVEDNILENYDVLISKGKFIEALILIKNLEVPDYESGFKEYNGTVDKLTHEVSKKQIPGFDYSGLLALYQPVTVSKYLRNERVKKVTQPKYEERVVKNVLGNPRKDQYGRIITEKIMVDKGGEVVYVDEKIYDSYSVNTSSDDAVKTLKKNGINY